MEFPINITIGELTINSHLIFELLAFFVGFRYFIYLRKKQIDPISSDNRIWVGTEGGGLSVLDVNRTFFTNYRTDPETAASLRPSKK